MKSYTDLEQSKVLAKMLPIESADMYWDYDVQKHEDYPMIMDDQFDNLCIPAWSLAALLDVLPNEIITDNRFECHYQIHIRKYDGYDNTTLYQIAYGNNRGSSGSWHDMINTGEKENLIDAVFQMICWLKENKKL